MLQMFQPIVASGPMVRLNITAWTIEEQRSSAPWETGKQGDTGRKVERTQYLLKGMPLGDYFLQLLSS